MWSREFEESRHNLLLGVARRGPRAANDIRGATNTFGNKLDYQCFKHGKPSRRSSNRNVARWWYWISCRRRVHGESALPNAAELSKTTLSLPSCKFCTVKLENENGNWSDVLGASFHAREWRNTYLFSSKSQTANFALRANRSFDGSTSLRCGIGAFFLGVKHCLHLQLIKSGETDLSLLSRNGNALIPFVCFRLRLLTPSSRPLRCT